MHPSLPLIWSWLRTTVTPTATSEERRAAAAALGAVDGDLLWALQQDPQWAGLVHTLDLPPEEEETWVTNRDEHEGDVPPPPQQPSSRGGTAGGHLAASPKLIGGWLSWETEGVSLPRTAPASDISWIGRIEHLAASNREMPLPIKAYGERVFWGNLDIVEAVHQMVLKFPGISGALTQVARERLRSDRYKVIPIPLAIAWRDYLAAANPNRRDIAEAACSWIAEEVAQRITPWLDQDAVRDTHAALQVQLGRWTRLLEITDYPFCVLASQTVTALVLRQLALQDLDMLWHEAGEDLHVVLERIGEMSAGKNTPFITYRFTDGTVSVTSPIADQFWSGLSQADREAVRFLLAGIPG